MRIAAIQMNSGADVEKNLETVERLLAVAAAAQCRLALLPENFALMPERGRDKAEIAETKGHGPIQAFLSEAAQRHDVWIVAGSMPFVSSMPERVYGTSVVVDSNGDIRACYRKIHLFDVRLPDSNESYCESHSMVAGDTAVTVETPLGRTGLTICYDLRFPELYRQLVDDGATAFTVPAAFTATTGRAHWLPLLRARAIENLAYVVAAGQCGVHPDQRATYGHSAIIDPWGQVLAEQPDDEGCIVADIDPLLPEKIRTEFPALANRRLPIHPDVRRKDRTKH